MFTCFRDPIPRTISHVQFLHSHINEEYMKKDHHKALSVALRAFDYNSLTHWKKLFDILPYLSNFQCRRIIGNLAKTPSIVDVKNALGLFDYILYFNTIDEDFKKLCARYNWGDITLLHTNNNAKNITVCNKECLEFIRAKNNIDDKLYKKLI